MRRIMLERRSFILGVASLITAPAIVRATSLMPVKSMVSGPLWLTPPIQWDLLKGGDLVYLSTHYYHVIRNGRYLVPDIRT